MPNPDLSTPEHGGLALPQLRITSYSLEAEDAEGLVGDQASQTAFREVLHELQSRRTPDVDQAYSGLPLDEMSNDDLDRAIVGADSEAAHALGLAIEHFAERLAYVVERFSKQPGWQGVERIAVGGGFKESAVGRLAIRRAGQRLAQGDNAVVLRLLRHVADDAGMVGFAHLMDPAMAAGARVFLAVDIGGTNVRCGLVRPDVDGSTGEIRDASVLSKERWNHADADSRQADLVEGIVGALRRLIQRADDDGLPLAPFIGVGCPGVIRADGSIERGAQNLPGDWESASFHLPRRLAENIPCIQGRRTVVCMHNDAVIQGLSELPFMADVRHWAVLTIGTGLGNASFINR